MKTLSKSAIINILTRAEPGLLLDCIEESFITYSLGKSVVPPVGTLTFDRPPGDVHIKYGYIRDDEHFVIKIASGFYENPKLDLPSSNGLNLVFNASNGLLDCILLDEGYLTDVRTALAGAVTAKLLAPSRVVKIGIVGTGIQARLQLQYLQWITDCRNAIVWGRSRSNAEKYCQDMSGFQFDVNIANDTRELFDSCDIIVTTTPSKEPLIDYTTQDRDILVTAMGADTVGKQELSEDILQNASLIAVDSKSQATAHGEIHKSVGNGKISKESILEIGTFALR